jgi:predicted small secreted protein
MKALRGVLYILLAMLVLIPACTSSKTGRDIKDAGGSIELTTKDHSMKALKKSQVQDTYVIFVANPVIRPESISYLDGRIVVLSGKDADQLKAQFGNFVQAENKGHAVARKSIQRFSLIAADLTVQEQIKKIIELNSLKQYPLVKLSMTELQVTELFYKKSKVLLNGSTGKNYLLSKVEIIKESYPL